MLQFRNPFAFKHVQVLKGRSEFDDSGPCIMMATPSMLQSGLSRALFEAWCEAPENTVIIAEMAVQGTLARELLNSPTHVMTTAGIKVRPTSHSLGTLKVVRGCEAVVMDDWILSSTRLSS
jgi:cleavage and polyadenylation specificity factor subunit 3